MLVNSAASSALSRRHLQKSNTGDLPPRPIEYFSGRHYDIATGGGTAGKTTPHARHGGVPAHRPPSRRSPAISAVQHACRNSRSAPIPCPTCRQSTAHCARHFEHRGVAQRQARRDLPCRGHKRHVPRRHLQRADADGCTMRIIEHFIVNRIGLAVHLLGTLRRRIRSYARRAGSARFSLRIGRPVSAVSSPRFPAQVLVNQVTQTTHQARALHRQIGPFRNASLAAATARSATSLQSPECYFRQHVTGRRVSGLKYRYRNVLPLIQ